MCARDYNAPPCWELLIDERPRCNSEKLKLLFVWRRRRGKPTVNQCDPRKRGAGFNWIRNHVPECICFTWTPKSQASFWQLNDVSTESGMSRGLNSTARTVCKHRKENISSFFHFEARVEGSFIYNFPNCCLNLQLKSDIAEKHTSWLSWFIVEQRNTRGEGDLVGKEGENNVLSVFMFSTIGLISQVSTPMKDD